MAEPVLKWAGGKRQIIQDILSRFPYEYNNYYEPFFGGGAVFFELEPKNGNINDINERLMNFYRKVRDEPEQLIAVYKDLANKHRSKDQDQKKEFYYKRRDEFNDLSANGSCTDPLREAALLLYLNKSCFNGLYRENEDGEFNVPIGDSVNISLDDTPIRRAHRVLQDTDITSQDFGYVLDEANEGDLVYFDPPYPEKSKTAKFNNYYKGTSNEDTQRRLRDIALKLDERGVNVLITNSPEAIKWYEQSAAKSYRITRVDAERRINSDSTGRTGLEEVIMTNIGQFQRDMQRTFADYR